MSSNSSPIDVALDIIANSSDRILHEGNLCPIAKIMQTIPSESGERLRQLIDETKRPGSIIADALTKSGYPVSQSSVQRHRRRISRPASGCKCP